MGRRVGVGVDDETDAHLPCPADADLVEIHTPGIAVDLHRRADTAGGFEDALQIEGAGVATP